MVGIWGVDTFLPWERKPGDMYGDTIFTTVYNTPSRTSTRGLSTTSYLRRIPLNIKEEAPLCT